MAAWRNVLIASVGVAAVSQGGYAQGQSFDIPAGNLKSALDSYAKQTNAQLIYRVVDVAAKQTAGAHGVMTADQALATILKDSGLAARRNKFGAIGIAPAPEPAATKMVPTAELPTQPVLDSQADTSANAIIVTAQRRREAIQDIPIAISAFTQESLNKQKIEGGQDLLKAVPNVTFSKSNFAGYNLEIRGIGTKAVSVSTDPGVAIDFNSTTLINNRFFEQEFFDLERVEVLRGPQGTLYGRNATGGVVNIISAKADLTKFDGYIKAEVGNYNSRRAQGAVNVPIITDLLGIRVAGAYTDRSGFTRNDTTANRVDSRNLYTTRVTASLKPSSRFRADLVWERFDEDDTRARTAKQLCHRDPGPESVGGVTNLGPVARGNLSQGCKPGSLYDDDAYGVPNGLSLAYVLLGQDTTTQGGLGYLDSGNGTLGYNAMEQTLIQPGVDPYGNVTQTRDRRRFSATFDPEYKARANVVELNATWDVTDRLALTSQSAYNQDNFFSTQDYNRFNSVPIFNASGPNGITPGGYYTDPQLGTSNRLLARDLVTARTKQFSQELRVSTTGKGPLQFTAGGNYTYYRNKTDYFVFVNSLTALIQGGLADVGNHSTDPTLCNKNGILVPTDSFIGSGAGDPNGFQCTYIDPNPIGSLNDQGHNYFRSSNRYTLNSYGAFADGTYELIPELKLIAGMRYNDDLKTSTPVPSQLLLARGALGGLTNKGYPANPDIKQHFTAFTGRAGAQWKPRLDFTNDTMIYATYSRGYKGGGTNPPPVGFNKSTENSGFAVQTLSYPTAFKPEYVNSFEIGTKNTLLNNKLTLNLTGYYYDFSNYQVSQIIDRSAVNENFDSTMYGLEFETVYRPFRNLTFNMNAGYQHTRIKNGSESYDVLDRLQGHSDYLVVKPFPQLPSNCVVEKRVVEAIIQANRDLTALGLDAPEESGLINICPGVSAYSNSGGVRNAFPDGIPASAFPNGGRGFAAQIGGNELPNAPHLTFNVGVEYDVPFATDWVLTPRVDFYHQSSSYARVYNTVADKLHGWNNLNTSIRIGNPVLGLLFEAYVKNVFNSAPITDAFVNSDDTGLPTNIFTYDPRTIGVNLTKKF